MLRRESKRRMSRQRQHEEIARRFLCVDCGKDTSSASGIASYYMVADDLWAATGLGG